MLWILHVNQSSTLSYKGNILHYKNNHEDTAQQWNKKRQKN